MEKLIFTLFVLAVIFLSGYTVIESEANIPVATVEQTAAVFDEVISNRNKDVVCAV